jgi:hypothetical protein
MVEPKPQRQKGVMAEVVARLESPKYTYSRIRHKRGWLEYLKDRDPGFRPQALYNILRGIISNKLPRGEKLLCLPKRHNYTVKAGGIPYRTEEALERFITLSNEGNFFNQVPIGGGKESIDIGIMESDKKFVFVELKPWKSSDSPLYGVIELLKNFVSHQVIQDRGIHVKHQLDPIELMLLAPKAYYQNYKLMDEIGINEENLATIEQTLKELSAVFGITISLMALDISENDFEAASKRAYKRSGDESQVTLSKEDVILSLARDNWQFLVSSGRQQKRT